MPRDELLCLSGCDLCLPHRNAAAFRRDPADPTDFIPVPGQKSRRVLSGGEDNLDAGLPDDAPDLLNAQRVGFVSTDDVKRRGEPGHPKRIEEVFTEDVQAHTSDGGERAENCKGEVDRLRKIKNEDRERISE